MVKEGKEIKAVLILFIRKIYRSLSSFNIITIANPKLSNF